MQVQAYYAKNTDMFSHLPNNIKSLFVKYVNNISVVKLKEIYADVSECNYSFSGITDTWLIDFTKIEYKINPLVVSEKELMTYMPKKSLNIVKAVKVLIDDLKYLTYLYLEGHMEEYLANNYSNIIEVLAKAPNTMELRLCKQFQSVGFGIPKMLRKDYMQLADKVALEGSGKKFYALIGDDYLKYKNTEIKIIDKINVAITRDVEMANNVDIAYFAQSMLNIKDRLLLLGIPTVELLYSKLEIKTYNVYGEKSGYRKATKKEVANNVAELVEQIYHPLDEEKTEKFLLYCYFCTGESKYLKSIAMQEEAEKAFNLQDTESLISLMDFLASDDCESSIYTLLKVPPIEYLEDAPDEIEDVELSRVCESVIAKLEEKKARDKILYAYDRRAYSIAQKGLEPKSILSEKQRACLYKAYRTDNFYGREIDEKVSECLRVGKYNKNSKIYKILGGVKDIEFCSFKQAEMIESAFAALNLDTFKKDSMQSITTTKEKTSKKKVTQKKKDTNKKQEEDERVEAIIANSSSLSDATRKKTKKSMVKETEALVATDANAEVNTEADETMDMEMVSSVTPTMPQVSKKSNSAFEQLKTFNMPVVLFNGGFSKDTKKKKGRPKKKPEQSKPEIMEDDGS